MPTTQSINFGKWLERLGLKIGAEPRIDYQHVLPVTIVSDHRHLVSHQYLSSYLVGSLRTLTVGTFAAFTCVSPVPILLRWISLSALTNQTPLTLQLMPVGAMPVLLNPVTLIPQRFRSAQAPAAVWTTGELAAAPAITDSLPTLRLPLTNTATDAPEIYIPPSRVLLAHAGLVNSSLAWAAIADELPGELPA